MKPIKPKPMPPLLESTMRRIAAEGGAMTLSPRELGAILAALEYERQRVATLVKSGAPMANACFNLAQQKGLKLTDREREILDECRREWDKAVRGG